MTKLLRSVWRRWRVTRLLRTLDSLGPTPSAILPLVARLRSTWGNGSWPADLGYLEEAVTRVLSLPGPFLECGAGLSTLILGTLAKKTGADFWSLEQDEGWCDTVRRHCRQADLQNTHVVLAPLRERGGVAWYDCDGTALPPTFSAVFCDGPAIGPSRWSPAVHGAWRAGVVPELRMRGIALGSIVLDDAEDPRCAELLKRWTQEGLATRIVETAWGRHVVAQPASDSAAELTA